MDKKKNISFGLSQEEVLVVLSYMQVKNLLGLDWNIINELSENQLNMAMGIAERSLIARGFLMPDIGHKFKLTDVVHAVVRACTNPDHTLTINCKFSSRMEETYFLHTSRKMAVLHSIPLTAIHQFLALENKESLARSAFSALGLPESKMPDCSQSQVSEDALNKARELFETGSEQEVVEALVNGGLDPHTASIFIKSMKKPILNHSIIHIIHVPNAKEKLEGFGLLQGENMLWMLRPLENDSRPNGVIELTPTLPQNVAKLLRDMLVHS